MTSHAERIHGTRAPQQRRLQRSRSSRPRLSGGLVLLAILTLSGCVSSGSRSISGSPARPSSVREEARWGITIESLRTTAGGNMLDFRYRVVDPQRALPLVERGVDPYLIDQESGGVVTVPNTAKVGPLRQTTKYGEPKPDRVYFILFSNPGRFIEPGSKVTVVIGDFRASDLVVE